MLPDDLFAPPQHTQQPLLPPSSPSYLELPPCDTPGGSSTGYSSSCASSRFTSLDARQASVCVGADEERGGVPSGAQHEGDACGSPHAMWASSLPDVLDDTEVTAAWRGAGRAVEAVAAVASAAAPMTYTMDDLRAYQPDLVQAAAAALACELLGEEGGGPELAPLPFARSPPSTGFPAGGALWLPMTLASIATATATATAATAGQACYSPGVASRTPSGGVGGAAGPTSPWGPRTRDAELETLDAISKVNWSMTALPSTPKSMPLAPLPLGSLLLPTTVSLPTRFGHLLDLAAPGTGTGTGGWGEDVAAAPPPGTGTGVWGEDVVGRVEHQPLSASTLVTPPPASTPAHGTPQVRTCRVTGY